MMKASLQPSFSYHSYCKALQLSYLMFVDDVMLFFKAHLPTLRIIMATLQEFHDCVGLQANHTKSHIVFGGCIVHLQQQFLRVTSFQEGSLPLRYLGVPITANKLSKLE